MRFEISESYVGQGKQGKVAVPCRLAQVQQASGIAQDNDGHNWQ